MSEFKPGFLYCPKCGKQSHHIPADYSVEFEINLDLEDDLDLIVIYCKCDHCDATWFVEQDLGCVALTPSEWVKCADIEDIEIALSCLHDEREDGTKIKIAVPVRKDSRYARL